MGRLRKFNVGIACLQRISEISMFLSQKIYDDKFISLRECLTLLFMIKIDNNFDNKFYKSMLNSNG